MQKVYKVGGWCRDTVMGLTPKDTDYVVVGATPEQMLSQGFSQVGADFPVFLHPVTGDEYALARKERKTGFGYTGFTCEFDPSVTLKEDLFRRDLTMNAIAYCEETGKFIDHYNGIQDIREGVLRHVSHHFAEDPLRVLRVARFAARYGFSVHPETMEMMRTVAALPEFKTISDERVFTEFMKAMGEDDAAEFIRVLDMANALPQTFNVSAEDAETLVFRAGDVHHFQEAEHKLLYMVVAMEDVAGFVERFKLPSDFKMMVDKFRTFSLDWFMSSRDDEPLVRFVHLHKMFKGMDILRRPVVLETFVRFMEVETQTSDDSTLRIAEHVRQAVRAAGKNIPEGLVGVAVRDFMAKVFDDALKEAVVKG